MEKKTPFDADDLERSAAFWVACVGAMCRSVAIAPKKLGHAMLAHALACKYFIVHFVETFIKYKAVGRRVRTAWATALGRLLIALVIDTRQPPIGRGC